MIFFSYKQITSAISDSASNCRILFLLFMWLILLLLMLSNSRSRAHHSGYLNFTVQTLSKLNVCVFCGFPFLQLINICIAFHKLDTHSNTDAEWISRVKTAERKNPTSRTEHKKLRDKMKTFRGYYDGVGAYWITPCRRRWREMTDDRMSGCQV